MKTELKDAIIKKVQDNTNEFQLPSFIRESFRQYIYTKEGEYIIGGKEVADFISEFVKIYTK